MPLRSESERFSAPGRESSSAALRAGRAATSQRTTTSLRAWSATQRAPESPCNSNSTHLRSDRGDRASSGPQSDSVTFEHLRQSARSQHSRRQAQAIGPANDQEIGTSGGRQSARNCAGPTSAGSRSPLNCLSGRTPRGPESKRAVKNSSASLFTATGDSSPRAPCSPASFCVRFLESEDAGTEQDVCHPEARTHSRTLVADGDGGELHTTKSRSRVSGGPWSTPTSQESPIRRSRTGAATPAQQLSARTHSSAQSIRQDTTASEWSSNVHSGSVCAAQKQVCEGKGKGMDSKRVIVGGMVAVVKKQGCRWGMFGTSTPRGERTAKKDASDGARRRTRSSRMLELFK